MGEIYLGECQKESIVAEYVRTHYIKKVFVFGDPVGEYELVKFNEMQLYRFYYRLLQETTTDTLVVMNEIMHTVNRYSLDYNCLRKYCLQTPHRIIFNYYPIRQEESDFMILYDMLQNNPFLKEKYEWITHVDGLHIGDIRFSIQRHDVTLTTDELAEYVAKKEEIIGQVKKDPDIIPRRLLKWSESHNRKHLGFATDPKNTVKRDMVVAVNQTGVDTYYYNRLMEFERNLKNVIQRIQGR